MNLVAGVRHHGVPRVARDARRSGVHVPHLLSGADTSTEDDDRSIAEWIELRLTNIAQLRECRPLALRPLDARFIGHLRRHRSDEPLVQPDTEVVQITREPIEWRSGL